MKYLSIIWGLLLVVQLQGQNRDARIAPTQLVLSEVQMLTMPPLDNEVLMEAERKRRRPGLAPRFAEVIAVDVKPKTHGHWEYLKDGRAVWRLRISSPGAYSLNLGFTLYEMPEGGQMILYSPDQKKVMGPFTPADNEVHAQLWTPVLEGDQLVIEVQLPKDKISELGLHLSTVNHDFMGFTQLASGNCNLDVICGAGDGYEFVDAYRDVIQSVAVYGLQGSLFCTGFLVNNTRQDCTPFFMTAAHCEVTASEAASLVVYWNYENSTCRELGSSANGRSGDGLLNNFNTGATLLASYDPSDMALLELDDPVSPTAEAYFAGWTRESTPPQRGVASVHHPNADEKSISLSTQPTYKGTWEDGATEIPNGDHIVVPEWSIGTTESGSSGGPLFDDAGLVVGQLHGGIADCASGGYDTFGSFAKSWKGGETSTSSLRTWLDPDNTDVMSLSGRSQRRCSFFVEAAIESQSVCAPDEAAYNLTISDVFTGPVSLVVNGLPDSLEATLKDTMVMPGESTELRISRTDQVESNTYSFTVIGTDGTESAAATLELNVFNDVPSLVNLLEPMDEATGVSIRAGFSWAGQAFTVQYEYEMARDPSFNDIVASVADLRTTELETFELSALTTYYWRVRGRNICGVGNWSLVRSFTTAGVGCGGLAAVDVPMDISARVNTVTSTINITAPGSVQELQLTGLDIKHSYVGDLRVSLISPQGTEVVLFERPGLPQTFFGCEGDNLELSFSDNAINSAEDLENTCNNQPAIQGLYQPLESFANFKGESVTGIWTLKVDDLVPEDAGSLNAWGLDFCTVLPQEKDIYTITDRYQTCAGEPLDLNLLLGTAFAAPATISVTGLPEGATAVYSQNPASPGTTIDVRIEELNEGGVYDLTFKADTARVTMSVEVLSLPEPVTSFQPVDGAVVPADQTTLNWQSSPEAEFYILSIFEEIPGGTPFVSLSLSDTSYTLEDLDFGTTYYWQVVPQNTCGGQEPDKLQSFFTQPNTALSANPLSLQLCQIETSSVNIEVGPGFVNPARISYRIEPADTIGIGYNRNPEAIIPGTSIQAQLDDLSKLEAGVYQLIFQVQDSIYTDSVSINLEIIPPPRLSNLMKPDNNAELLEQSPAFEWSAIPEADRYLLELATDVPFSEIIQSHEITSNEFRLMDGLDPGTYYWRVSVINRCGGATSAAFRFTIKTTGITEWHNRSLKWHPNPTSGIGYLKFPQPLHALVHYEIMNSAGIRMHQGQIASGMEQAKIDLTPFPAGVYLLRLRQETAATVIKVIKQ